MNLLLIAGKVWRYKLVTLPIIGAVVMGAVYMAAVKQPVYQASASYILVPPPAPPTPDEIARDPKLGRGSDNPYTRFSDQSLVVQVLSTRLSSDDARLALAKQGADPRYTVAPDVALGVTAPIVQVSGMGPSPEAAIRSADIVGTALTRELTRMQSSHGVAPRYRIDTQQVVAARDARLKASGQLRSLVAVLVFGVIVLFLVVSVLDAVTALRKKSAARDADGGEQGDRTGWTPDELAFARHAAPAEHAMVRGAPDVGASPHAAWHVPENGGSDPYVHQAPDPDSEPWPVDQRR